MSEVSELRDIFFNRLEKTSYGKNQIKDLFNECYFSIHKEQNLNNSLDNIPMDKIITNVMSAFFGNTYNPKVVKHNIKDIELSEHFFKHKDNFISMFKDVTLTYGDTDIDIYYCNEHNIRMFKILYKV